MGWDTILQNRIGQDRMGCETISTVSFQYKYSSYVRSKVLPHPLNMFACPAVFVRL